MSDNDLNLGTNQAADKASDEVAKTLPCAAGCGRRWDDVLPEDRWHGFMPSPDGAGLCFDPIWTCDPCFMAKHEAELEAERLKNAAGDVVH